jgi:hypothetical protein
MMQPSMRSHQTGDGFESEVVTDVQRTRVLAIAVSLAAVFWTPVSSIRCRKDINAGEKEDESETTH